MKVGKRILELRKRKGLTQDQMADLLDVKRARYNSWENGIANPNIEMINKLADIHQVPTDYILGTIDEIIEDDDIRAIQRSAKKLDKKDRKKVLKMMEAFFDEEFDD